MVTSVPHRQAEGHSGVPWVSAVSPQGRWPELAFAIGTSADRTHPRILGQPQKMLRHGLGLAGTVGMDWDSPTSLAVPRHPPQSHMRLEGMGTVLAVGWGRSWEQSWTAASPCPSSFPRRPGPSWGTSELCHHCHQTGMQGELHIPTPPQGAAGEPGEPPAPLPATSGGILTRVSSLAGVPGAIPGGGVPGGGFFPGKGAQAPLGGGITLSARMLRCLGGP